MNRSIVTKPRAESVTVELAVKVDQEKDFLRVEEVVKAKGIKLNATDFNEKTVRLELGRSSNDDDSCDIQSLQRHIEQQTGFITVIKGLGSLSSAVSELRPSIEATQSGRKVMGIVRWSQLPKGQCYVDALVDGFNYGPDSSRDGREQASRCSLAIHEYGDLSSDNLNSIGPAHLEIANRNLTNTDYSAGFKLSISKILPNCDVPSIIGKSVAITEYSKGNSAKHISAGVIARASTVESNKKQICTCSGKNLWQERLDKQRQE